MHKLNLLWDITNECNLRCIHCYNANTPKKCSSNFYMIEPTKIIKQISELGFTHIHLLGGEPLLYKNLSTLINAAIKNNIDISINTNGLLLTDSVCELLLKSNVSQVVISLDGASPKDNDFIRGKGVFEKVTQNIRCLSNLRETLNSNTIIILASVITKSNIQNIHKIVSLANELGIDYIDISALYHNGNAMKNLDILSITAEEYYEAIKKILAYSIKFQQKVQVDCKSMVLQKIYEELGLTVQIEDSYDCCQAGKTMIYMDAELNLFPCGPYAYKIPDGEFKINLFNENALKQLNQFSLISKNTQKHNICKQCPSKNNCNQCPICYSDSDKLCEFILNKCVT